MSSDQGQQRDIVYCHQCENEWFRDEHGLECPTCHSDFTEIVEADHDPRAEEEEEEDEHFSGQDLQTHQPRGGPEGFYAPDPDEDDIDNLQWEQTGPDRYRLRGTYRTDIPIGQRGQAQGVNSLPGGLMGIVGNVLQGLAGVQQGQRQGTPGSPPGRALSAPGSPPPLEEQGQRGSGGTYTRHAQGPGFSYTITTSSNWGPNQGQGNLFPRNATGPQPFQPQPDHIEQMLAQMINNIGAMPGMPGARGGPPFSPDGFGPGFGQPPGGAFIFGGSGPMGAGGAGGPGMGPFANLFNLFGPPGGVAGDAVYSQEALDRIITQLMEQHQAGNAPGPATDAAIKSLPTRAITTEDQGENGQADCSICMDEVPLGEQVTTLPCGHWFHFPCVKAWLSEHDTCPHCRQGIMPRDGQGATASTPRSPTQAPLHNMMSPENTRVEPGTFPFPRMGSESPTMQRRASDSDGRRASSGGGGMFSRMRDAFSRGGSSGGGSGSGENRNN